MDALHTHPQQRWQIGDALMSDRKGVEFFKHSLGPEEIQACQQVLGATFLTTGPACKEFEEKFAAYLGVGHAVTVASATQALEIALTALGIGPGDEVITTPMTFIATANAVLKVGATPVFADVEPGTGLLDPEAAEAKITGRTKAIIPVHLYGNMCDMRRFRQIANRHELAIVADCAHAVESRRDALGSAEQVEAAVYSFYATKNLTCGEGGALATQDTGLAERFRKLRLHGMSKGAADRYNGYYRHWDMEELGFKANLSDILAVLLITQLAKLEDRLQRREEIARRYEAAFTPMPEIDFPRVPQGSKSARHLFTIWTSARDRFLHELQKRGIGVAVNYRAVHLLTYYRQQFGYEPGSFAHAEDIGNKTLTLPLYPLMSDGDVEMVISACMEVAKELY